MESEKQLSADFRKARPRIQYSAYLLELDSSTIWIIFPGRYRRGYWGGEFKCDSSSRALYEGDR